MSRLNRENLAICWIAPRGIGTWAQDPAADSLRPIRRRFMLLGQTLDGMRVWDIRQAIRHLPIALGQAALPMTVVGSGDAGVLGLYAALFEPSVTGLKLDALPESLRTGPDFLNGLKILDIPQALELTQLRIAESPVP
jgi:hypothetical protein